MSNFCHFPKFKDAVKIFARERRNLKTFVTCAELTQVLLKKGNEDS
jgi:hypothetical protein